MSGCEDWELIKSPLDLIDPTAFGHLRFYRYLLPTTVIARPLSSHH